MRSGSVWSRFCRLSGPERVARTTTTAPSSTAFCGSCARAHPGAICPGRYGPVGTVSSRFYRWRKAEIWQRVLSALQAEADAQGEVDWDLHFVDATIIRAH